MSTMKLGPIDDRMPDEDEVASELSQMGLEWEHEMGQFRTTFTCPGGMRCELAAAAISGGVRVSTTLAQWDGELGSECQAALTRFLDRANARLRFARAVINGQQALVESIATTDRWELELPDSVFGVTAAFRAIAREVDALLSPQIAGEYLRLNAQGNASKSV